MKIRVLALLVAAAALVASSALAAGQPDISGKWLIDAAKSDFGPMPAPGDLTFEITVAGEDFYVKQSGGGQPEVQLHFSTSGKEMVNEMPGARMTSVHRWEGNVLVADLKVAADDGSRLNFKDRISYSPDGKVMTMKRDITALNGEGQMTIVLTRQ